MLGETREEVLKRRAYFSSQLSTQCRTLSLGLLAFTWALMTGKDSPLRDTTTRMVDASNHWQLVGISCLAIGVLCVDAVQYFAGLQVEEQCLKKFKDVKTADERRTYSVTFARRVQDSAFYAKIVGLIIAVVWLLGFLGCAWHR